MLHPTSAITFRKKSGFSSWMHMFVASGCVARNASLNGGVNSLAVKRLMVLSMSICGALGFAYPYPPWSHDIALRILYAMTMAGMGLFPHALCVLAVIVLIVATLMSVLMSPIAWVICIHRLSGLMENDAGVGYFHGRAFVLLPHFTAWGIPIKVAMRYYANRGASATLFGRPAVEP
mmetsp:Transcript_69792/g.130373  ORF Transcript_69792/g.130373 Transcript_69792/m.130373 type:complete len:177 (+) Transcript_69792:375-905(+)